MLPLTVHEYMSVMYFYFFYFVGLLEFVVTVASSNSAFLNCNVMCSYHRTIYT